MKSPYILIAAGLLGAAGTVYAGVDAPRSLMKLAYGTYNSKLKCWIAKGGQLDRPHCMKPVSVDRVTVDGRKLSFLLVSGNEVDLSTRSVGGMGAHMSGGLVGMFVYSGPDSSPRIIAQEPKKELGTYGDSPEGKFVRLGPDRYGWQFSNGFTGQGYTDGWLNFYTLQKNGMSQYFIQSLGNIPVYHDDSGAIEDENLVTVYDGKATIAKSDARDGFYPVHVTMERQVKGKKLSPQHYEIRYSYGKGEYALPAGYPLEEQ